MRFQHAVDNGNIRARDLVYRDVSGCVSFRGWVRQEEQVAAVERGFHRPTARGSTQHIMLRAKLVTRTHLKTTTMGDSVFVTSPSPFHIMKPDASTWMKLRTWSRTCATA